MNLEEEENKVIQLISDLKALTNKALSNENKSRRQNFIKSLQLFEPDMRKAASLGHSQLHIDLDDYATHESKMSLLGIENLKEQYKKHGFSFHAGTKFRQGIPGTRIKIRIGWE